MSEDEDEMLVELNRIRWLRDDELRAVHAAASNAYRDPDYSAIKTAREAKDAAELAYWDAVKRKDLRVINEEGKS